MDPLHYIYRRGDLSVESITYLDTGGIERCAYTSSRVGPAAPDLALRDYLHLLNHDLAPDAPRYECLPWETVAPLLAAAQDAAYLRPWKEITEERWDEMLKILPPEKWQTVRGVNIFRMCEYTCGNITTHFARVGSRFFEGSFRTTTAYEDLAGQVAVILREPVRTLTCCCCGETTKGRQWWNRDTGFGICAACITRLAGRETPEDTVSLYGIRGVHYAVEETLVARSASNPPLQPCPATPTIPTGPPPVSMVPTNTASP
jgi:hypothetical protein